jgi:cobalt-zinc-cadmium efflux system outer membrane protein
VHSNLKILVLGIMALPAVAQEKLTLSNALSQAIGHHPQLEVSRERIAVAEGLRRNALLRPNPRLVFQTENLRSGGVTPFSYPRDTDTFAYLTQVFETAGKRAKRVELADSGVRRSELERELAARQIVARVSLAYWTAAGAAGLRNLLEQDLENFGRVVQFHRDRVREGAMAEADLIRVEVEQYRLAASARNAARDVENASIALLREMGRTDFPKLTLVEPAPAMDPVSEPELSKALEIRPEIRLARQTVEQARANLQVQRSIVHPDLEILFGYKRAAGYGDSVLAGVQIPLPLVNRNQGQIAAAEAEVRSAEAQVVVAQAAVKAELAAALADAELRRRTLVETLEPMRQRADETARIAQAAYREGGSDLLRLLDAERTRIETQVLYHRALAEFQQSLTALQLAAGVMP